VVGPDRADGRTDREELSGVCAPGVVSLTQVNADDALCVQRLGFGLHASHRELPRVVQRLRELRELGVLAEIGQHVAERAMCNVIFGGDDAFDRGRALAVTVLGGRSR
jgi:hypothetical protein